MRLPRLAAPRCALSHGRCPSRNCANLNLIVDADPPTPCTPCPKPHATEPCTAHVTPVKASFLTLPNPKPAIAALGRRPLRPAAVQWADLATTHVTRRTVRTCRAVRISARSILSTTRSQTRAPRLQHTPHVRGYAQMDAQSGLPYPRARPAPRQGRRRCRMPHAVISPARASSACRLGIPDTHSSRQANTRSAPGIVPAIAGGEYIYGAAESMLLALSLTTLTPSLERRRLTRFRPELLAST